MKFQNKLPIILLATIFFQFFFLQKNYAQFTVKAEIKKPQLSLVGSWGAVMEIRGDTRKSIAPDYIYEFKTDGTYELCYVYFSEKADKNKDKPTLFIVETGKWEITDKGKVLKLVVLVKGNWQNPEIPAYALSTSEVFEQADSKKFIIKRTEEGETVEYVFFRKFNNWNVKVGPPRPAAD